jgi:hypothetical protein
MKQSFKFFNLYYKLIRNKIVFNSFSNFSLKKYKNQSELILYKINKLFFKKYNRKDKIFNLYIEKNKKKNKKVFKLLFDKIKCKRFRLIKYFKILNKKYIKDIKNIKFLNFYLQKKFFYIVKQKRETILKKLLLIYYLTYVFKY